MIFSTGNDQSSLESQLETHLWVDSQRLKEGSSGITHSPKSNIVVVLIRFGTLRFAVILSAARTLFLATRRETVRG
jgi:hypothetical protein